MVARAVVAVVVLGVLAAACGGGGGGGEQGGGGGGGAGTIQLSDGRLATDRGTGTVSGTTATVEAGEFFFSPTILTGPAGQEITLTVTNVGQALHNFSLPDQDVDVDVQPGQETEVTVTLPSSGALTFECKYHLAQNMLGELRAG